MSASTPTGIPPEAQDEFRRQSQYLAALHATALGLLRRHELGQLLESIIGRAGALLGTSHGYVYLAPGGEQEMQLNVGIGRYREIAPRRVRRGEGLAGRVWQSAMAAAEGGSASAGAAIAPHAHMAAPLRSEGGVLGVLGLYHLDGARSFDATDVEMLSRFAQLATLALENARLYEAVQQELLARKQTEEELEAQRDFALQIMGRMGQGLFVTDADGRFEYVNSAGARMLGQPPSALQGKTLGDMDWNDPDGAVRRRPGDHTGHTELRLRRADGTTLDCLLTLAPRLREGRVLGSIGVLTDLTDRKRAEEAMAAAKEAAEAANRAKSEFLARMSHELRTPIHSMLAYADILAERLSELPLAEIGSGIERIREAGQEVLSLIGGVLDISRIEAGKLELYLQTFDVAELTERVADTVRPMCARGGNSLEVTLAPDVGTIHADRAKLRQALVNLLSNAAKFTENGRIGLLVQRHDKTVSFAVSDTGIGIPASRMGELFQRFHQIHGDAPPHGAGLGLAISRSFCHAMGGDITVESNEGKGSCFTIRIPIEVEASPEATQPSAPALIAAKSPPKTPDPAAVRPTVLVVDDDGAAREVLRRTLEPEGFRVIEAKDGRAATALLSGNAPDVILVDLMMPRMDGFQFLREVGAAAATRTIPILVVTAMDLSTAHRLQLGPQVRRVLRKGSYARTDLVREVRALVPRPSA